MTAPQLPPPIPPWAQRVITVAAGGGIALLSLAFPPAAAYLVPMGVGLAMTVIPHPADWWRRPAREQLSGTRLWP